MGSKPEKPKRTITGVFDEMEIRAAQSTKETVDKLNATTEGLRTRKEGDQIVDDEEIESSDGDTVSPEQAEESMTRLQMVTTGLKRMRKRLRRKLRTEN